MIQQNKKIFKELKKISKLKEKKDVKGLIKILNKPITDLHTHRTVIGALAFIKDPLAVEPLCQVLQNRHDIRLNDAIKDALINMGAPHAVLPVCQVLKDEWRNESGTCAAEVLSVIGNDQALDVFFEILNKPTESYYRNALEKTKKSIFKALRRIKSPRSINDLINLLISSKTSKQATNILLEFGKIAVEPLCRALNNEDYRIRRDCAIVLGDIGDPSAVSYLIKMLSDADTEVQESAVKALGKIPDPRVVEVLIKALENEDSNIRAISITFLGEIKDPRAVGALIKILEEDNPSMQKNASWALGEIGDIQAIEPLVKAMIEIKEYGTLKTIAKVLDGMGWKPENDNQNVRYLVGKGKWDKLADFGAPVVALLCKIMKNPKGLLLNDVNSIIKVLDEFGDPYAVETLFNLYMDHSLIYNFATEDLYGKNPEKPYGDPSDMYTSINRSNALEALILRTLQNIAKTAVEPLITIFQKLSRYQNYYQKYDWIPVYLIEIGDLRAIDTMIDWLFSYIPDDSNVKGAIAKIKELNLFGDYTDLILQARELEVLEELCSIPTVISSNILHKIMQYDKIETQIRHKKRSGIGDWTEEKIVDFSELAERAGKELQKRGNPPYDSSVYLNNETWKV